MFEELANKGGHLDRVEERENGQLTPNGEVEPVNPVSDWLPSELHRVGTEVLELPAALGCKTSRS